MATQDAKENIADGLGAGLSFQTPSAPSPKKSRKSKTRSKSIGPSGLSTLEEKPSALKESNGNRRKSAFPAVKSILVTNDIDEKKRREARRKSLARRRVSFNPEATLHSWDIVAYAHDETSSTVSDATRRASAVAKEPAQPSSDAEEPPSTPPERVEEPEPESGSSPGNQRDAHRKKNRRRSSGIPPLNFNNPDDILSSSPLIENTSPVKDAFQDQGDDTHGENDSQSSARLDAALRQASELAGTQRLNLDSDEDMSMVIAEDDVTASFKPWAKKNQQMDFEDQEKEDPFFKSDESEDEDMSMDITRAVGKIVAQQETESPGSDDMSMDLTTAIGSIKQAPAKELPSRRKSLKRRVSMLEPSQGSPAKRSSSRRTSLRAQAVPEEIPADDQTMDFTVAIGAIKSEPVPDTRPPSKRTRASGDSSFGDETMDFTIAVGSIKDVKVTPEEGASKQPEPEEEDEDDMDMSMEFTTVVGPGIKRIVKAPEQVAGEPVTSPTPNKRNALTPQKSPKKSPGRLLYPDLTAVLSATPQKALKIPPSKSPRQPRRSLNFATPETKPAKQRIEDFEASPFVHSTPQSSSKPTDIVSTPKSQPRNAPLIVPDDPIEAPILNRRRSSLSNVQFSPLAKVAEEPTLRSAAILSNNIKLLSTPRKQTLSSPVKRGMTPKKSQTPQKEPTPKQKTPTPKKRTPRKSMSPKKKVAFGAEPEIEDDVPEQSIDEEVDDAERISLQDFLDLTRIRFMEVSATKRRHTAAPASFHDKEVEEQEQSLDQYVVAGACIVPEYECYSHACHELKQFISSGRDYVRTLEENVEEENPLLFSEYLTAPPDQRAIMDNQFKNLKTNARLETRGEWYTWRTNLLRDLKSMLLPTLDEFKLDESVIRNQELLLEKILPPLQQTQERLSKECGQLQQRHDELNNCNREELEQVRERLVAVDTELEEKRQLVARMQQELEEKEARIEAVKERKVEYVAEIKAAERVREECRGWSTTEVSELHAKVCALEQKHGWSITSASGSTITMTYKNDLELYFQPSAFATGADTPNASISLTYVGNSATPHPRPLTTSKRFFLQLIRAHLHCIPQSQTRVKDLLDVIKNGWATASAVAEGVRWLEHSYITDETILSDERMAVSSNMLLPTLQTKVRVTFEIGVSLGPEGAETEVTAKAELVYGEKFKTEKMGTFLEHHCGSKVKEEKEMSIWADACLDLVERLRATGRKGERV
ncbi:Spc7-domain-containing protein [Paraphaeosphaeria sporulosa]|uniref:Spc7-domain-containing protein n=1 Tax=Paraphaeosphaeria sporulosa TaxID=1460663 RepID=A0A177CSH0_9PLEO|nr:Spc7-domain-containing protein [Paraphaeosphaeria sporulosa]OAG10484.1 Spc7-domain-containing protein [Paraphaeosphaeria sporulosa]